MVAESLPPNDESPPEPNRALTLITAPVVALGEPVTRFLAEFGRVVKFVGQFFFWLPRRPFRWGELFRHMRDVGFGSLFIVCLTGFFTGMVFAFQTMTLFRRTGTEAWVGSGTLLSLARELAPVLTGLMVAGRSGSGMATELGTMKVTEQVDALEMMAVNPIQYLVVPRVLAAIIVMPFLCAIFDGFGFAGCWIMAVIRDGLDPGIFFSETWTALDPPDFVEGYIKAGFFGLQISIIGCYMGFKAEGGARGVGRGATAAVVLSSVSILVGTYLLSEILHPILYGYIYFDALPK
jgi:phospholipid/cholesterol/gamma-HCH transport system permease protein